VCPVRTDKTTNTRICIAIVLFHLLSMRRTLSREVNHRTLLFLSSCRLFIRIAPSTWFPHIQSSSTLVASRRLTIHLMLRSWRNTWFPYLWYKGNDGRESRVRNMALAFCRIYGTKPASVRKTFPSSECSRSSGTIALRGGNALDCTAITAPLIRVPERAVT